MSLASEINSFNKKAIKNSEKVYRGTTISLFGRFIKRSPVKTGRLRGNWQTSLNRPKDGELDRTGAAVAIAEVKAEASLANLNDSIYITNNLPYAQLIENGSSTQAPTGMVEVSLTEFNREVERQARRVR